MKNRIVYLATCLVLIASVAEAQYFPIKIPVQIADSLKVLKTVWIEADAGAGQLGPFIYFYESNAGELWKVGYRADGAFIFWRTAETAPGFLLYGDSVAVANPLFTRAITPNSSGLHDIGSTTKKYDSAFVNVISANNIGTMAAADSTIYKSQFLKNADSTTLKAGLLKNADSTTLKAGLLKNADSTTVKNTLLNTANTFSKQQTFPSVVLDSAQFNDGDGTATDNGWLKAADLSSSQTWTLPNSSGTIELVGHTQAISTVTALQDSLTAKLNRTEAIWNQYGELYIDVADPDTITVSEDSTYYAIGGFTAGTNSGVSAGTGSMQVTNAGTYQVSWKCDVSSLNMASGTRVRAYIYVEDVQQVNTGGTRWLSGTSDYGSFSGQGILTLSASDEIKLKIASYDDASGTIYIRFCSITVRRLN